MSGTQALPGDGAPDYAATPFGLQYLRRCQLLIGTETGDALDVSLLRIRFSITAADSQTPKALDVRIFNLSDATSQLIQKEYAPVRLSVGYGSGALASIFSGNVILGSFMAGMGLAAMVAPRAWLFAVLLACSACSAVGGPMQDITMATLRQTALPLADMAAAVRAYMVMNALGMLLALLAAPWLFGAIGVAQAVLLCGAAVAAVGIVGLLRHGGRAYMPPNQGKPRVSQ